MKRFTPLVLLLLGALTLSACGNTIRGAGRDIGNTVDATGEAAEEIAN